MNTQWLTIGQGFRNGAQFLSILHTDRYQNNEVLLHDWQHFLQHLDEVHLYVASLPAVDDVAFSAHQLMVLVTDVIERANARESTDKSVIRSVLEYIASRYLHDFETVGAQVRSQAMLQSEPTSPPASAVNESRIWQALDSVTEIQFTDTPLRDIVAYIAQLHDIPVLLDTANLTADGITGDEEITVIVSGITLRSALNLMLGSVHDVPLGFVIQNEVLKITTRERMWEVHPETRPEGWEYLPQESLSSPAGISESRATDHETTIPDGRPATVVCETNADQSDGIGDGVEEEPGKNIPPGEYGFLNLKVDTEHCEVRRNGHHAVAYFKRDSAEWHTFVVAWNAGKTGATQQQWTNGYPGDPAPEARKSVKRNVNDKLQVLGIRLALRTPPKLEQIDEVPR